MTRMVSQAVNQSTATKIIANFSARRAGGGESTPTASSCSVSSLKFALLFEDKNPVQPALPRQNVWLQTERLLRQRTFGSSLAGLPPPLRLISRLAKHVRSKTKLARLSLIRERGPAFRHATPDSHLLVRRLRCECRVWARQFATDVELPKTREKPMFRTLR